MMASIFFISRKRKGEGMADIILKILSCMMVAIREWIRSDEK